MTGPGVSRPAPTHDGGQPAGRTRLAWRRTTLAASVIALLAMGQVLSGGARPAVVAVLVAVGWAGLLLAARSRIRALRAARPTAPHHTPAALALLTAAIALGAALLIH